MAPHDDDRVRPPRLSPELRLQELLGKAVDALPSGRRVLIYGYHVSDDETRGLYSARRSRSLNVLASGQGIGLPGGGRRALARAGCCGRVRSYTGLPCEHGLIVGWKA